MNHIPHNRRTPEQQALANQHTDAILDVLATYKRRAEAEMVEVVTTEMERKANDER